MRNYLSVLQHVKDKGFNCWLVGSAVRDIIVGVVPAALSMVVDAKSFDCLIENFGGEIVQSRTYPYVQSKINGLSAQMSLLEGKTIAEELALRDFSMNAIAIRYDGFFEDPFMGRHDIRNRLVRITGDNTALLEQNPLRVVRMIRFAVSLDMNIYWKSEQDARNYIENNKEKIAGSMSSRWGREIFISMRGKPYSILRLADHYGLLPLLVPDLYPLKEINISETETLFSHTFDTMREIERFVLTRKARPTDLIISLVGLFHHIGSDTNADSKISPEIARNYLKRWGAPDNLIERVLTVMGRYREPYAEASERTICEAAYEEGFETVEAILDFALCNSIADKRRSLDIIKQNRQKFDEICRRVEEMRYKMDGAPRYITVAEAGSDEKILREHDIRVGTGEITSRREALAWLETQKKK